MKTFLSLTGLSLWFLPAITFAQEAAEVTAAASTSHAWGLAFAFIGAGIATGLACTGSAMGVSITGQAGAGLMTERPDLGGKVITLMVLPGSQGLYGMVISLLFFFNYGEVISGEIQITAGQGLALFGASLPVAISCVTSSPYQGKACAAGMNMIAKDEKLLGRVITIAALVETYALFGFLISFFMYNAIGAVILGS